MYVEAVAELVEIEAVEGVEAGVELVEIEVAEVAGAVGIEAVAVAVEVKHCSADEIKTAG